MIIKKYLPFAALAIVLVLSDTEHENSLSDEQGTGRIFPLLPPYYGVDYAANFNKLKSSGDAAYFVVRDSMVFLGVNLFWFVIHSIIWDGEVSNVQDITASLLSPGVEVELSNPSRVSSASSRLTFDSLLELSPTKMWNFFANPNTSTRNLFLNIGFALGGHILWILPTFLGTLEEPQRRSGAGEAVVEDKNDLIVESEDRVGGLPSNLLSADPVALWNRLFCPQCILQIVGINSINYFGKLLFWIFMSSVPDLPAETVIGRSLQDESLLGEIFNQMGVNAREMMDTVGWWEAFQNVFL